MQITVETKDNRRNLTIDLSPEDVIDKFGYGVLTNNRFDSLADVFERQLNDRRALLYRDLPDNTVNDWLDKAVDEHALMTLLRSIADTVATIGSFSLFAENLLMRPEMVYVTETGIARFVYVPVEGFRQDYTVLELIRDILECVEPKTNVCAAYVRQIGMLYAQEDLDIFRIRDALGQLENYVVEMPAPAPAPAPSPVVAPPAAPAEMPADSYAAPPNPWGATEPAAPFAVPPQYPAPGMEPVTQGNPPAKTGGLFQNLRTKFRERRASRPSGLAKPAHWDEPNTPPPAPAAAPGMADMRTIYQPQEDMPDFGVPEMPSPIPNAVPPFAQAAPFEPAAPIGQTMPFEPAAPFGQNEPFAPAAPFGQNEPFAPAAPFGQNEPVAPAAPFGQNEPVAPAAPFGQNKPFESTAPFGQNEPFVPAAPFGQNEPVAPAAPFGQNEPFEPAAPFGQNEPFAPAAPFEPNTSLEPAAPWQAESTPPAAVNPAFDFPQSDVPPFAPNEPPFAVPAFSAWDAEQADMEKTISKHPGSVEQMEQIAKNNAASPLFRLPDDIEPDTEDSPRPVHKPIPQLTRVRTQETATIDHDPFIIGKEQGYVDFFVRDNPHISRAHANILTKDGKCYIVDTNSTNHTYVNGVKCESNVETELQDGDTVRLANEDFTFLIKE